MMLTVQERVRELFNEHFGTETMEDVQDDTKLGHPEAVLDSLDMVEALMAVEDRFEIEIPDDDGENLRTLGQITAYLERRGCS